MGKDLSTSGEARCAILTDVTKFILILNHKQLETGIKACIIGSKVVIELSNDDHNNNSIDIKKKNVTSIITNTTSTTLPSLCTFTAPLKNSNNMNHSNNKHDINLKVENMNADNADNDALHSKTLFDLVIGTTFKLDEARIGMLRYLENISKTKT